MSKRFFAYLILIFISYAMYSYTAYKALLYLLILLIVLPIISFLLLLIGRYFINVSVEVDRTRIYRENKFNLIVKVENKSIFYFPMVKIEFNLPKGSTVIRAVNEDKMNGAMEEVRRDMTQNQNKFRLYKYPHFVSSRKVISIALPQNSTLLNKIELKAVNRGTYKVGTNSILVQDLFSFFYLPLAKQYKKVANEKRIATVANIEVLPNPLVWNSADPGKLKDPERVLYSNNNKKVSNEVDTIANVREYQQGDRMKQIHWKLSARTGDWLTREFEDPRQGGILFVLDPKLPDTCNNPIRYSNNATEILAASMHRLARTEGPLNLLLGDFLYSSAGEGSEPVEFYEQLMYWQPQLKRADLRAKQDAFSNSCELVEYRTSLSDLLNKELQNKTYRAVVVCTARMSPEIVNELLRAEDSGSQVVLLFMHNEDLQNMQELIKPIVNAGIKVLPQNIKSILPLEIFKKLSNGGKK